MSGRTMPTGKPNKKTLKRINLLIEASTRQPFTGIAKPEALKGI